MEKHKKQKRQEQEETYNSVQAAKMLCCSNRTVTKYINEGKLKARKGNRDWAIDKSEIDRFIAEYGKEDQLCAKCRNACGGCRWSDELLPVEGWNAEPTKIYINKGKPIDSFHVIACPMYIPDRKKNVDHLTNDAAYRLMYAILFSLVRDYANSCKKLYVDRENSALAYQKLKEIQQYVKTPMFDEMLGVMKLNIDGPKLLEMIREDPINVIERIGRIDGYSKRKEKSNDYQGDE